MFIVALDYNTYCATVCSGFVAKPGSSVRLENNNVAADVSLNHCLHIIISSIQYAPSSQHIPAADQPARP